MLPSYLQNAEDRTKGSIGRLMHKQGETSRNEKGCETPNSQFPSLTFRRRDYEGRNV